MPTLMDRTKAHPAARAICLRHGDRPDALIEILHEVQAEMEYISDGALAAVADALNLSKAEVTGVVSFYHDFKRKPGKELVLQLCRAEACQAVGAEALFEWARARFESTDEVEVKAVYCLGNCALGPAAMIGNRVHGRMTKEKLTKLAPPAAAEGASG
jgi:formate dehydrogenase subunit gamma